MEWHNNYFLIHGEPTNLSIHQKVGGAVVVPTDGERFLLLKIVRKDSKAHLEFPRGFAKHEEESGQTALRELKEETNLEAKVTDTLGTVMPDSGIIDSKIKVVKAFVNLDKKIIKLQKSERIMDYTIVNLDELSEKIRLGKIIDGYTLSAYAMLMAEKD